MLTSTVTMLALAIPLLLGQIAAPRSPAPRTLTPPARAALPREVPPWNAAPGRYPSAEGRWSQVLVHAKDAPRPIVFIGDSITQNWLGSGKAVWDASFGPLGAYDIGIAGDETQQTLWRIGNGALDGLSPRVIVIMIGTNDLGRGWSATDTVRGIQAVVDAVRVRAPLAQILLLGITPRDASPQSPMRLRINDANRLLASSLWPNNVTFRDLGGALLADGGVLIPDAMADGLHPSVQGYQRIASVLLPEVQRLAAIPHQ